MGAIRAYWCTHRVLLGLGTAAALFGAIACSGSKSPSSAGTPVGTSTPAGTPTPNPQPTITGNSFVFPARGYASTIPDGWHANPNSLLAGPQTVDTFFSTDTVDGVQSNISVTCEENREHISTDQYVQQRTLTLNSLGATDMQTLAPLTIGGVPAQEVTYTLLRDTTTIRKIDVMFTTQSCAWTLASASAPSIASENATTFATFLQSFKLLAGDVTPQSSG